MTCPECGLGIPRGESACPICGFAVDPASAAEVEEATPVTEATPVMEATPVAEPAPAASAASTPPPSAPIAATVHRRTVPACGGPASRCAERDSERPARRSRVAAFFRALGRAVIAVPGIVDRVLLWSIRYQWDFLTDSWGDFERESSASFVGIGRRIGGWIGIALWKGVRLAFLLVILAVKIVSLILLLVVGIIAAICCAAS